MFVIDEFKTVLMPATAIFLVVLVSTLVYQKTVVAEDMLSEEVDISLVAQADKILDDLNELDYIASNPEKQPETASSTTEVPVSSKPAKVPVPAAKPAATTPSPVSVSTQAKAQAQAQAEADALAAAQAAMEAARIKAAEEALAAQQAADAKALAAAQAAAKKKARTSRAS